MNLRTWPAELDVETEPEPSVEEDGDDNLLDLGILVHLAPRCLAKSDGLRFRRKVRISRYMQPRLNTSAAISASAGVTGLVVTWVWVVVAVLSA